MFKRPFSFEGRIRRTEFGISVIIFAIVFFFTPAISLIRIIGNDGPDGLFLIVLIPLFWFLLAQGAKRCHDVGNSGWWQLIPFYFIWLLFKDGQPGTNQYGENPKGINTNNQAVNDILAPDNFESNNNKKVIIPESCPHCKNPNTRLLRLCEWCGNQIC